MVDLQIIVKAARDEAHYRRSLNAWNYDRISVEVNEGISEAFENFADKLESMAEDE